MQPRTMREGTPMNTIAGRDFEVEKRFQDFSRKYDLRLRIPSKDILERSPQKRHQLAQQGKGDPDETIYRRFRIHFRRGTLNSILETYHKRAKAICDKLATESLEQNITAIITGLPRATNSQVRNELKLLFERLLQEHNPISIPKVLRSGREIPAHIPEKGTPPMPIKRNSVDSSPNHPHIKRPKSSTTIPSSAVRSTATSEGQRNSRSFYGLSTNVSHETIVLSGSGHQVSQGTETTVEASSQERARWPPAPPLDTLDKPSLSFSSIRVLIDSNAHNEDSELQGNVSLLLDGSSPTHTETDFNGILSDSDPELARLEESITASDTIKAKSPAVLRIQERLHASWPRTPLGLAAAPFVIIWEVLRVLLHCKVDIDAFDLQYDESWKDQNHLWRILQAKIGQSVPSKSSPAAWNAALADFRSNKRAVVLMITLTASTASTGPFFQVQLHPLKFDRTYRLARRFGPDRFVEMIVPSVESLNVPNLKNSSDEAIDYIRQWVATNLHPIAGRLWKAFSVRSPRDKPSKKSTNKKKGFEPEPKQLMEDQFYLFAQDGDDFHTPGPLKYPAKDEPANYHTKMSVISLIEWLLQPSNNISQPSLKLFSRISLGLSRTEPTITLEKNQFRHMKEDIRSEESGLVMNDGIGRISPALARRIRDSLGLVDTPAGFQGRVGSAKGFWIIDVSDTRDEIWIETYPSQRKWDCDFDDEDHRVFEVVQYPQLPVSASLNAQFLPILMEGASTDPKRRALLRDYLDSLLISVLKAEIDAQQIAMQDPLACSVWVDRNSASRRQERLNNDEVPRLGGLFQENEDRIKFFLAAGFGPLKQKKLFEWIWDLCKERCEELKKRMNIRVGRSVYAYMVFDFEGILAENEVHLNFSSNFRDEISGFSDTYLHGMDVLVARNPAHLVSDIQKVKAVFKPELGALKDVIVFPSKGSIPLAEKLSGGDYDGDQAWVCWDPDIVNNFEAVPVPKGPDLFQEGFLSKHTSKFEDLQNMHGNRAILKFLEEGLEFNSQPKFLGVCTSFKESLCYQRESVSDSTALRLSTMLSYLVDQPKQGIIFTLEAFMRFKKSLLNGKPEPLPPKYKADSLPPSAKTSYILDHLKFDVIIPTVDRELGKLSKLSVGKDMHYWDDDLVRLFHDWDSKAAGDPDISNGMKTLMKDLDHFHRETESLRAREDISFDAKVSACYEKFRLIKPSEILGKVMIAGHCGTQQTTLWSLLRASTYYKSYYNTGLIWWIIGSELQELKAKASPDGPIVHVNAQTYASMRHDPKYIRARSARLQGVQDPFGEDDKQEDGQWLEAWPERHD